jgi:hypothetical protein
MTRILFDLNQLLPLILITKPMLQNLSKNIVSYVEQNDWFQDDLVFFLPIFENQGD